MTRSREIPFAKFHGLANDWIVVADADLPRSAPKDLLPGLARSITDRHTGVGADGLIIVLPPQIKKHDTRLRFFNPDGSEAEISGNGIRCATAFLLGDATRGRPLKIETLAGVKNIEPIKAEKGKWIFRVAMGTPIFDPAKIPFKAGDIRPPIIGFPLPTQGGNMPVTVASVGNPHCTVFIADFTAIDWVSLGREIERNELFPRRTNVEFVKVISRNEIDARFWERGVGETSSSGTGSCAALVACVLNGRTGRKVRVRTQAGVLDLAWPENGELTLTGPAEFIARGIYFHRR